MSKRSFKPRSADSVVKPGQEIHPSGFDSHGSPIIRGKPGKLPPVPKKIKPVE